MNSFTELFTKDLLPYFVLLSLLHNRVQDPAPQGLLLGLSRATRSLLGVLPARARPLSRAVLPTILVLLGALPADRLWDLGDSPHDGTA